MANHIAGASSSANALELAEIDLMKLQVTHRARISYMMIGGAFFTLAGGLAMLVAGLTGAQAAWVEYHGLKVTAGGFGAVALAASVAWGLFAWLSRPTGKYQRTTKVDDALVPARPSRGGGGGGGGKSDWTRRGQSHVNMNYAELDRREDPKNDRGDDYFRRP